MITENDLLNFVRQATPQTPKRAPGQGITASELGAAEKKSRDWGRDYLNSLVDAGLLKRTWMTWVDENSHPATGFVYEKP